MLTRCPKCGTVHAHRCDPPVDPQITADITLLSQAALTPAPKSATR
jgi:hypothetical protein